MEILGNLPKRCYWYLKVAMLNIPGALGPVQDIYSHKEAVELLEAHASTIEDPQRALYEPWSKLLIRGLYRSYRL